MKPGNDVRQRCNELLYAQQYPLHTYNFWKCAVTPRTLLGIAPRPSPTKPFLFLDAYLSISAPYHFLVPHQKKQIRVIGAINLIRQLVIGGATKIRARTTFYRPNGRIHVWLTSSIFKYLFGIRHCRVLFHLLGQRSGQGKKWNERGRVLSFEYTKVYVNSKVPP